MAEEKKLVCIGCPKGCVITIKKIGKGLSEEDFEISGNTCPKGFLYAFSEMTHPMRTLTCTIRVHGGERPLVPAKSVPEVPKELQLDCMQIIRRTEIEAPVYQGDILIPDILGTGSDIIAGEDVKAV
jgi:CxxC motif-containing protein